LFISFLLLLTGTILWAMVVVWAHLALAGVIQWTCWIWRRWRQQRRFQPPHPSIVYRATTEPVVASSSISGRNVEHIELEELSQQGGQVSLSSQVTCATDDGPAKMALSSKGLLACPTSSSSSSVGVGGVVVASGSSSSKRVHFSPEERSTVFEAENDSQSTQSGLWSDHEWSDHSEDCDAGASV
jgi:hypothetical protein